MTTEPQAPSDPAALQAQVSGSSFYAAMRVMPKPERAAMFAIYSFCRMVDDIADDGTRPRALRATELDRWRADLDALYADRPAGRAGFLKDAVHDFGLRQSDFLAVIDGMQMDVDADIRAPDLETLNLYCDRVAVAVGRLSIRIFGMEEGPRSAVSTCRANCWRRRESSPPIPARRLATRASTVLAGIWPRWRSNTSRPPTACCALGRAGACWRRG
jgi:phytoene/squalene synthetase